MFIKFNYLLKPIVEYTLKHTKERFAMSEISILMPVYNSEKYLSKVLESLLNQTFTDIEIICVNDGSTDQSLEICQSYASDPRLKIISQPNQGAAQARNTALREAQSPYIMFCDSDDWYEPDMCQKMWEAIKNNDADLVVCNCTVIDEGDTNRPDNERNYYTINRQGLHPITTQIIIDTNVVLWSKIFKKSLIDQYQMDFPAGYNFDDDCFYLQYMYAAQNIYFLNQPLYNYLRRKDSIMGTVFNRKYKNIFDQLYIYHYLYDFLERTKLFDKYAFLFYARYASLIQNNRNWWKKADYKQARQISQKFFKNKNQNVVKRIDSIWGNDIGFGIGKFRIIKYHQLSIIDPHNGKETTNIRISLLNFIPLFRSITKKDVIRRSILGIPLPKKHL